VEDAVIIRHSRFDCQFKRIEQIARITARNIDQVLAGIRVDAHRAAIAVTALGICQRPVDQDTLCSSSSELS
jgi:hypothetical protein